AVGFPSGIRTALSRGILAIYHTPSGLITVRNTFQMFYTKVFGKLFCTPCNVVLEHERRSTINSHFESAKYMRMSEQFPQQRQITMTEVICEDWVHTCTAVNMPLSKSDHSSMRQFLKQKVINGGAIPGYHQLQQKYLGDRLWLPIHVQHAGTHGSQQCSTTSSSLASTMGPCCVVMCCCHAVLS
uniref:Uncharacterized protein n=1 Tax=Salmo trutta TaxID=8032 RepID=A0A673ZQ60_SALTR